MAIDCKRTYYALPSEEHEQGAVDASLESPVIRHIQPSCCGHLKALKVHLLRGPQRRENVRALFRVKQLNEAPNRLSLLQKRRFKLSILEQYSPLPIDIADWMRNHIKKL